MEVKLVVMGGKRAGQEVPVPHSKFLIGRAEDCHLRPGSELVSRHHAVILVEEGFVAVRDFASKNGTFVNGQRIKTEQELKSGDRLTIGPLEFEVRLTVPVAGKRRPKVHNVHEAAARTVETVSSAPDNEVDISDWLGDEEDSGAESQTAAGGLRDTTSTAKSDIADTTVIPPQEQEQHAEAREKKPKEKPADFTHRLQEARHRAAADSTSAADDVLRRFFGRKS
jgi:predicted component of type VI protein secretion system